MAICEYCGRSGIHAECEHRATEVARARETRSAELAVTLALHGKKGIATAESEVSLAQAERVLVEHLGEPPEYERREAIEGDKWWFIPVGWVGMTGFIVEKESKTIYPLGSGLVAMHATPEWPSPWCSIREYLAGRVPAAQRDVA